eukprot:TRINITY_DN60656_c0_g1_i1.p1 TRINITY_DN60656_c0_g1~~TRINITY_DN60656_c0_g1_i1.p1  ORF type:complete len:166 (-),score=31.83 TRINITY_DN60656_c0_g1_i1:58-513(-)
MFGLAMTCYGNIDEDSTQKVLNGSPLSAETADVIFKEPTSQIKPTKEQFTLMDEVMQVEQKRILEQMTADDMIGAIGGFHRKMSTPVKALYTLIVLGLLVAGGLWSYERMTREKPTKERSSKSTRQKNKANDRATKHATPSTLALKNLKRS